MIKGKALENSTLSRRMFLGASLAAGMGAYFYLNRNIPLKSKLYANEVQVILQVSYHLFPNSKVGPGAADLHIAHYLAHVFKDKRIPKGDRDYFLKGGLWLEESSFEEYNRSFLNLNSQEKEALLQQISRQRWGENFIYTSLNYIFEALLSSPVYGANPGEIGWQWLEHDPGFPQPITTEDISYEV